MAFSLLCNWWDTVGSAAGSADSRQTMGRVAGAGGVPGRRRPASSKARWSKCAGGRTSRAGHGRHGKPMAVGVPLSPPTGPRPAPACGRRCMRGMTLALLHFGPVVRGPWFDCLPVLRNCVAGPRVPRDAGRCAHPMSRRFGDQDRWRGIKRRTPAERLPGVRCRKPFMRPSVHAHSARAPGKRNHTGRVIQRSGRLCELYPAHGAPE